MWEKFTTKPLVDTNTFRHIGDCPSPWPCFVIAVREEEAAIFGTASNTSRTNVFEVNSSFQGKE